jgi:putative ATP-binding cassette transporter
MLLNLIRRYRCQICLAAVIGFLNAVLILVVGERLSNDAIKQLHQNPALWSMQFVGLILALLAGLTAHGFVSTRLTAKIRADLREGLVQKTLNIRYEAMNALGGHKVLAVLTKDVDDITLFLSGLPHYLQQFFILLGCIGFMLYQSVLLFFVPFLIFLGSGLLLSYLMNHAYLHHGKYRACVDRVNAEIKTMIDSAKERSQSASRNQAFYQQQMQGALRDLNANEQQQDLYFGLATYWSQISTFLCLGSVFVMHGLFGVGQAADVVAFVFVFFFLQGPIATLTIAKTNLMKAKVGLQAIEALKLNDEIAPQVQSPALAFSENSLLEYRDLSFAYEQAAEPFAIAPTHLKIQAGEIIFLRGGNGSGKSTLAQLLTGLLTPKTGAVFLNGVQVCSTDLAFRGLFGVVHTNSHLFKTVIDAKGQCVTNESAHDFLKFLKLDHKVKVQEGWFSNIELSQGQKKRLALMLTYFENTPILLLDEFAADQDPSFRKYFYEQMIHELRAQGKTIVAITHDDSYFHHADRLLVMNQGTLVEAQPSQAPTIQAALSS